MKTDFRQLIWRAIDYIFPFLCATAFIGVYSRTTLEYPPATLPALMDGSASKPFVMRVLMPTVIRLVSSWWSVPADHTAWAINWVCLLWLWGLFRFWISRLWPNDRAAKALGPLLLLYAVAVNVLLGTRLPYRYPYDLPGVAFFLTGVVAFREGRLALGLGVFAIGVFNRESILFLLLAYILLRHDREEKLVFWANSFAMICWWVLSRKILLDIFRENHGGMVEFKLFSNFDLIIGNDGNVFDRISIFLCCGFLWAFAILDWKGLPDEIRRLFLLWPPFLLVNAFFANIHELRVYNEMAPITAMGALHLFQKIQTIRRERLKDAVEAFEGQDPRGIG